MSFVYSAINTFFSVSVTSNVTMALTNRQKPWMKIDWLVMKNLAALFHPKQHDPFFNIEVLCSPLFDPSPHWTNQRRREIRELQVSYSLSLYLYPNWGKHLLEANSSRDVGEWRCKRKEMELETLSEKPCLAVPQMLAQRSDVGSFLAAFYGCI